MTSEEENNKHYFDLGFMQGKRKFNVSSFIEVITIGFGIAWLLFALKL